MQVDTHVLVKPDGVAAGMVPVVLAALAEAGLSADPVGQVHLTMADAVRWYPEKLDEPDGPLTLSYLCEGPMTLIAVSGADAVRAAYLVKRQVRERYATDDRRNMLHCPETVGERDHERAVFAPLLVVDQM